MNLEQAYIEGFVKRAADYGYSQEEALGLLKTSGFLDNIQQNINDSVRNIADAAESDLWNRSVGELTSQGIPFHKAVYGMNNVKLDELANQTNKFIGSKYDKDMFPIDHPILSGVGNMLRSHNIDPTTAALAAGGAGLLGGGYMLGKHLHKNKQQPQSNIPQ
jgi:phage-related protein